MLSPCSTLLTCFPFMMLGLGVRHWTKNKQKTVCDVPLQGAEGPLTLCLAGVGMPGRPTSGRAQQSGVRASLWHSYNHSLCTCGQIHPQMVHDEWPTASGASLLDSQPLCFVPYKEMALWVARDHGWLMLRVLEEKSVTLLCCPFSFLSEKIPVTVIFLNKEMMNMSGNYSRGIIANEKICIYVVLIICLCFTNLNHSILTLFLRQLLCFYHSPWFSEEPMHKEVMYCPLVTCQC